MRDNLNLPLEVLRGALGAEREVAYRYVVASVANEGGRFAQRGSGPNFQGGAITLCTCKHRMRSYRDPEEWKGRWIAGFTGLGAGEGKNALVYLMKIGHAFESHHDLWNSGEIPAETKRAKSAKRSRHGDLFEPVAGSVDPYDPRSYHPPREAHPHCGGDLWHADVRYAGARRAREAALLVGDPALSFLWDHPTIVFPTSIGRSEPKAPLDDLLSRLERA